MLGPFIAAVAREGLLAVPVSQREAALGMGATRWEAVWTAVVPYGRAGLIGAVILGLGRALGETMAVTMLIGNRHDIGLSVLQPAYTMAAAIANEFSEATTDLYLSALFEVGRSEEHTSELQSQSKLVCRPLLEKKKQPTRTH